VKISWREIWYFFKKYKKYVGLEIFLGIIGEIENYILPIFLFLTFNNVLSIGFLASLLAAGSALFTLLIGRIIDKVDKNKFLRIGVMVMLIVFIGRYFAITQIQFYILSVCAGFFGVLISLPFNSIVYQNARQNKVENFIVFREIPIAFGRLLIYSCALLLISKIKLTFLLAALSYLLILFL
jgi:MFS family permease